MWLVILFEFHVYFSAYIKSAAFDLTLNVWAVYQLTGVCEIAGTPEGSFIFAWPHV
jgi:hypothetical protein